MITPVTIDKNKTLLPDQDYEFLRGQGIEFIQNLSGKIWTDHNTHDPGITILELLCYALTDLGYRTSFEMKDLLTKPGGGFDLPEISGFFPAHEILTTNPLTITDYRKLLVKLEGVKNAWLNPMTDSNAPDYRQSEVPIYANCHEDRLDYDVLNTLGNPNHPIQLTGLYKVLLELEIDEQFGSLNDYDLMYIVKRGPLKGLRLTLGIRDESFVKKEMDLSETFVSLTVTNSPVETLQGIWTSGISVSLSNGGTETFQEVVIRIISDKPDSDLPPLVVTALDLQNLLEENVTDSLFPLFWSKQRTIDQIIGKVCCVLDAHRNLCADFLSIDVAKACRIALCADIELKPDADIELTQAKTYHAIEQYFNPQLKYYTLTELLDEGLRTDEIFNGPYIDYKIECNGESVFTKPGFNKTNEIEATQLRRFIYTSDIINILMDFEEVIAVKNVMLRKYDANGQAVGESEKWCLEIPPDHQPVFYIEKTKVLYYKNNIPYTAKAIEFENTLMQLRELAKKAAYVAPGQTLPITQGVYRETDTYFTVQNDFPMNYGIGEEKLPSNTNAERRAKAKQLKGYLTFYDQLLADYLSQLTNVRNLFSLDPTIKQTYFSQYLDNSIMTGVDTEFETEMYLESGGAILLADDERRTKLIESKEHYYERKNKILDHLLARFAEQFTDYVLMSYSLEGDKLKIGDDLIDDKINFLQVYPELSRQRGKAFNYRPEDPTQIWDTSNVSGLEKRLSRLLGIENFDRRNLHCAQIAESMARTRSVTGNFQAVFRSLGNTLVFRSQETFANRDDAQEASLSAFTTVRQASAYAVIDLGSGNFGFTITGGGVTLTHDGVFSSTSDTYSAIHLIIATYDQWLNSDTICTEEGFHLIEHILLRPFSDTDALMGVCLPKDCAFCGEEDPYSFKASLILPYWPGRFNDINFRQFFEQTARKEAPAHIHLKICWVSNDQMMQLDERYRAWLEAKSTKDYDPTELSSTLGELIDILQQLKTINPKATLHDCEEDGDENPVRLGFTNLGIF
ncbi:MAG: hypothetical protein Mars2KO_05310 [Maribacter sp.]